MVTRPEAQCRCMSLCWGWFSIGLTWWTIEGLPLAEAGGLVGGGFGIMLIRWLFSMADRFLRILSSALGSFSAFWIFSSLIPWFFIISSRFLKARIFSSSPTTCILPSETTLHFGRNCQGGNQSSDHLNEVTICFIILCFYCSHLLPNWLLLHEQRFLKDGIFLTNKLWQI